MEIVPSSHGFTEQFIGKTMGSSAPPPLGEERLACPQESNEANFVLFPSVLLINVGEYPGPEEYQVINGDPATAVAN
jgi:hypothetical protein